MDLINKILGTEFIDDDLQLDIMENINKFKNVPISELDSEHEWVWVDGLKLSFKTEQSINQITHIFGLSPKYDAFFIQPKVFHCLATGANALTYQYKNAIIKPFKITKHSWTLTDQTGYRAQYKCSTCDCTGSKPFNVKTKTIIQDGGDFLTCEENLIKNIIL